MKTLKERKRPRVTALATLGTVKPLDDTNGPRHDVRTRRKTARDAALNTIITPELHLSLRMTNHHVK